MQNNSLCSSLVIVLFYLNTAIGSFAILPKIHFATVQEGVRELSSVDDFVSRLSSFDRSARLKTSNEVSQADYLKFVVNQVEEWPEGLKTRIQEAWVQLASGFDVLKLPKVESILLVRTTGKEEGGAGYTRGQCIILPDTQLHGTSQELAGLLAHELFHVVSRADPVFRDRLYQQIGFEKCEEVILPPSMSMQRITNPDAPVWAHAINVTYAGKKQKVVPILLSSVKSYPEGGTDEFFHFLALRFWPLTKSPENPALLGFSQIEGFMEQVGQNTNYIIHPEEILADNFKLILTGAKDVPSPMVLERIRAFMMENR